MAFTLSGTPKRACRVLLTTQTRPNNCPLAFIAKNKTRQLHPLRTENLNHRPNRNVVPVRGTRQFFSALQLRQISTETA